MESNKKNERVKYNILFVPDSADVKVKQTSVRMEYVIAFFAAVAFLLIVAFAYCFILTNRIEATGKTLSDLNMQVNSLTEENTNLKAQNKELEDKVSILSDTVNDKVQKEEEIALSFVPTGFPLAGTAAFNEGETELDGKPIAVFEATVGTKVTATGSGTVASVEGDSRNGFVVTVNHDNGYLSIYRNGSEPSVKEGDSVTNTTELYLIEEGKEKLGYQVIYNDEYINPLEVMEIYG